MASRLRPLQESVSLRAEECSHIRSPDSRSTFCDAAARSDASARSGPQGERQGGQDVPGRSPRDDKVRTRPGNLPHRFPSESERPKPRSGKSALQARQQKVFLVAHIFAKQAEDLGQHLLMRVDPGSRLSSRVISTLIS